MSTLKATTIEPATGTNVTLGTTGDTVALPGNTLVLDTWKDSGGNTLFTSNGSGTVSSVNAGLAGAGPVLIQSQTASGSASIEFTTGLDSTYDRYMFVFVDIHPATDNVGLMFDCSVSSSYGTTKTTTYFIAYHNEAGSDTSLSYQTSRDLAQGTGSQYLTVTTGNAADECASGVLHLIAPASTTYVKQFYSRANSYDGNNYTMDNYAAGYINTTSAVDGVKFTMSSGNIDAGTFKLYGVK